MAEYFGCCEHCEHGVNDAPHGEPCPEGCSDDDIADQWWEEKAGEYGD